MISATVTGNLQRGRDDAPAVVTKDVGGNQVTEFTISVYHGKDKRSGEHKRSYVRVSMWGQPGVWFAERYVADDEVSVRGELELRKWDGGAGLDMRGEGFDRMFRGSAGAQQNQGQSQGQRSQGGNRSGGNTQRRAGQQDYRGVSDDSIPF